MGEFLLYSLQGIPCFLERSSPFVHIRGLTQKRIPGGGVRGRERERARGVPQDSYKAFLMDTTSSNAPLGGGRN